MRSKNQRKIKRLQVQLKDLRLKLQNGGALGLSETRMEHIRRDIARAEDLLKSFKTEEGY